ncbi:MAG: methyltransferase domain-containing protein [Propionibacteriaceae bacterium]|nr:methyltransferase domain-containing protein [Propionibacteriaceae bacterium]
MRDTQSEGDVRQVYDRVADAYADRFTGTEAEQPLDLAMIECFASLLPDERRVLDAGCGTGRLLPVLARLGCAVEGVDLSSGMVRRARQDHPSFTIAVGSLTDLPHAAGTFEGCMAWYSTIHSPDHDVPRILAELARVLRDGGVLLIAFQSGDGLRDVSEAYRAAGHDVTLTRHLRSLDQMAGMLSAAGFTEVARMERQPMAAHERDSQAFLIARR